MHKELNSNLIKLGSLLGGSRAIQKLVGDNNSMDDKVASKVSILDAQVVVELVVEVVFESPAHSLLFCCNHS